MRSRAILAVPLSAMLLALGACQSYERRPLDLAGHADAMFGRDVGGEDVRAFADRLHRAAGDAGGVFDPTDGLSLGEAELAALVLNPRLRAARLAARVPAVGAEHAGRWEDPELRADVVRVLESVEEPWIGRFGVGFTLPLSGRLKAEKAAALAEAEAALHEARLAEWELLVELRETWYRWSAAEREAELHHEYGDRIGRLAEIVGRLAEAGEAGSLEARLLKIQRTTRAAAAASAAARAREQRVELMRLLGLVPDAPVELLPALDAPGLTGDAEPGLLSHPRVALAEAEYRLAEERLQREVRKQYPDLTVGPGYEYEEGQSRVGLGGGLPIPVFNRNRRGIAEAAAARDAQRAEAEAAYEAVLHDVAALRVRLEAAEERVRTLRENVAPLVDEQLREAEALIAAGEMNVLLLHEALSQSLEVKTQVLEAAAALAALRAQLRAYVEPPVSAVLEAGDPQ